jgi:hypothetical protein
MYDRTNRPVMPVTLAASAARTVTGNTGNLKDTATSFPMAASYSIVVNVTAFTNVGAASSCLVTLDQSFDGGTTWMTFARFSNCTTSSSTERINIRNGLDIATAGAVVSTTSASLNANTLMNRDVRVTWTMAGGTPTVTFQVFAFVNPDGLMV